MCIRLKKIYASKLEKAEQITHQTYSQNTGFRLLPVAFQKYLIYCGFNGQEKIKAAQIKWKQAALKFKVEVLWKPIFFRQHNFLRDPLGSPT